MQWMNKAEEAERRKEREIREREDEAVSSICVQSHGRYSQEFSRDDLGVSQTRGPPNHPIILIYSNNQPFEICVSTKRVIASPRCPM